MPRIAKGIDALVQNVINGMDSVYFYRDYMPPRGGSQLTDAQIRRVVEYMVNQAEIAEPIEKPNKPGFEKCYGVSRAGSNDCGTSKHACAGMAKVDYQINEWVWVRKTMLAEVISPTSTATPTPTPQVTNGVISTASKQAVELVHKAYLAYYGRPGDPAGIDYWAQKLDATGSNWTHEILAAFGNSDEFQSRFGNLSNAELVNNIYLRLFNREAEQAGLDYFVTLLESGQSSLSQIAVEILNGASGNDVFVVSDKLSVCDYFSQKVADGAIIYDSIDTIKDIISGVFSVRSKGIALHAIDAIANQ